MSRRVSKQCEGYVDVDDYRGAREERCTRRAHKGAYCKRCPCSPRGCVVAERGVYDE